MPIPASISDLYDLVANQLPASTIRKGAVARLASALGWTPERLQRSSSDWTSSESERIRARVVCDSATMLAWQIAVEAPGARFVPSADPVRHWNALSDLLDGLPTLALSLSAAALEGPVLRHLIQLAVEVPTFNLTLEVDEQLLACCWETPDSHEKGVLRSVWIRSGNRPVNGTEAQLKTRNADAALQQAATALAEVEALRKKDATHAEQQNAAERARSLAEQALFELLESRRETRGLFHLNHRMDFAFGPRPAELDLYSEILRICIEVDGFHHFVDTQAYRRDRKKDALVQQHGIWMLRVLAEDVIQRTDDVTAFLLTHVRARIRGKAP